MQLIFKKRFVRFTWNYDWSIQTYIADVKFLPSYLYVETTKD